MNFTNFSKAVRVKCGTGIRERDMSAVWKEACEAERNVYIDPVAAIKAFRTVLEKFYSTLLTDEEKRSIERNYGPCTLHEMMKDQGGFLDLPDSLTAPMFDFKKMCNQMVHEGAISPENPSEYRTEEYRRIGGHPFDVMAVELLGKLYGFFCDVITQTPPKFTVRVIPIGSYDIVRCVKKSAYSLSDPRIDDFNRIVRSPQQDYYFVMAYSKRPLPLAARNQAANAYIRQSRSRRMYLQPGTPIQTSANSRQYFIAYPIFDNSLILSECPERGITLSVRQSMDITFDIICALEEMLRIGIVYRNVNPDHIILHPDGDSYQASIINFESAYFSDPSGKTVFAEAKEAYQGSAFIPAEVQELSEENYHDDVSWDKVAVYSCAVLLLWCIEPFDLRREPPGDMNDRPYSLLPSELDELAEMLLDILEGYNGAEHSMLDLKDTLDLGRELTE